MKFASCEIPLFGRHVIAAMDCSEQEALHHFTRHCQEKAGGFFPGAQKVEDARGWAQTCGGDIYLWSRDSVAILFHEIVHAAFKLCQAVDIAIDEELIARLVEYLKLNLVDQLKEVKEAR